MQQPSSKSISSGHSGCFSSSTTHVDAEVEGNLGRPRSAVINVDVNKSKSPRLRVNHHVVGEPLDPQEIVLLRSLVETRSEAAIAIACDVSRYTLGRALGGMRCYRPTLSAIRRVLADPPGDENVVVVRRGRGCTR